MIPVIYTKYTLLEGEHRYQKEHILGRRLLRFGLKNTMIWFSQGKNWKIKSIQMNMGSPS